MLNSIITSRIKIMTQKLVEIARSFSYKHNLGNYQSCDFFCSEKAEVPEDEAEKKSEELYQFCKKEVIKSLNEYLQTQIDMQKKAADDWQWAVAPNGEKVKIDKEGNTLEPF